MRIFNVTAILSTILFGSALFSEDLADSTETDYFMELAQDFNQPALDPEEPAARNRDNNALPGFAEMGWMTTFDQAREIFRNLATAEEVRERVEILHMDRNRTIVIRRNDIQYRYNFYKTPYSVARLENPELNEEEYDEVEAVLFHVKVTIPFIEAEWINDRIENAYGPRTRSTVDDETLRGTDIWELDGGFIFQWYEPYNQTAYTRTLDYMSQDMVERILEEFEQYFDAEERRLLQNLIIR